MPTYNVTYIETFSTSVQVEADTVEEAIQAGYDQVPGDSIVGFDWEPDGECTAFAAYDADGNQVWQEKDVRNDA